MFTTLRVETDPHVGTGFIVNHKWAEGREGPFLVTNKHVVQSSTAGRLTFTRKHDSGEGERPSIGLTAPITLSGGAWEWVAHPCSDIDVAVLPLAHAVSRLGDIGKEVFYKGIPTTLIPTRELLEEFDAIEDILFVGYPSGIYDHANNLPIIRKGSTATHLAVDYEGKPIFLIDASVFQGSSGSPVLIYDNGVRRERNGKIMAGHRAFLLGVLGAAYFRETDGKLTFEKIPTALQPVIRTNQMIDLGVVYKANTHCRDCGTFADYTG